jgi:hypothetical protein
MLWRAGDHGSFMHRHGIVKKQHYLYGGEPDGERARVSFLGKRVK